MDKIIKNDIDLAERTDVDNNNITLIIYIQSFVKVFKLIITILSITYYFGAIIYIIFQYIDDAKQEYFSTLTNYELELINSHTFISYFEIKKKNDIECSMLMLYYSFTTLSTIGFGDYHPVSDEERIIVVCGLLFGVMIFSFSMGVFI